MKKRILDYRNKIDTLIQENSPDTNWENILNEHLTQISFFQHERLVHLIVMVLFALMTFMSIGIAIIANYSYMFLGTLALLILLVPYITHYYLLENEVQHMYEQYDIINERRQ
ncbi:MAG: hypothetical protein J6L69_10595 [Lachnospiraceae bacterium]|nr:hypothetical protein [Lachnospiraceae bacterium]